MPTFKEYDELIDILKDKGFEIKDSEIENVKDALKKESYYNIVNGYKDFFLDIEQTKKHGKDILKTNASFFELKAIYDFDREIRILFLKYILIIESNFKSALSHEFSKLYGCNDYLKIDNFDITASNKKEVLNRIAREHNLSLTEDEDKIKNLSEKEKISEITKLFEDIQQEITRQTKKNNPMITHYMNDYGYIPLWVLVNALTLGKITTLYMHMKDSDKIKIAKRFNLQHTELHKYMSMLGIARNKCAHCERFYNLKFKQNIHTKNIFYFNKLGIPKDSDNNYKMGQNDVFAITVIFKQMLTNMDFRDFSNLLKIQFDKLAENLKTITLQDVQKEMGFFDTWTNIKNYKTK